eukprot:2779025-Rhodomonas_salina.4
MGRQHTGQTLHVASSLRASSRHRLTCPHGQSATSPPAFAHATHCPAPSTCVCSALATTASSRSCAFCGVDRFAGSGSMHRIATDATPGGHRSGTSWPPP